MLSRYKGVSCGQKLVVYVSDFGLMLYKINMMMHGAIVVKSQIEIATEQSVVILQS